MTVDERTPLLSEAEDLLARRGDDTSTPIDAEQATPVDSDKPKVSALTILLPLSIGIFLSALDWMIVASSYAAIGSELDALQSTSWIATAYMLTTTSFQPLYGKLSDIFGRKACLLFAYFTFALGCLLCGLSRNITELIAARAFSGIGGGGITTVGSIIMSDVAPLRQRGTWQGFANIVFAAGQAVGAPLGGLLADTIGWRWSFLLQVPLALLAITSVTLTLKLPKTETSNFISNLKRVDFLGAITLVTAIFLLLVGLDRGGNLSWQHPITVASLSGFAILFPAFILIEWKFAKEPFAPKHIVMEPTLLAAYLCNFLGIGAQMAFIYHASLYFQAVEGRTAARAGLFLIPNVVTSVTGSLGGGLIMQITGRYRTLTITAFVFGVLGTTVATLYAGILGTSDVLIVIGSASAGLGIGTAITTTLIALIANAGPQNQAVATAVSYLFRSLGSVVGLSLVSTAAQETLRSKLYSRLSGNDAVEEIIEGARKSLNYIAELPPKIREKVVLSYADSVRLAFWLSVSLYLAALISSWYIKEKVLLPK